MANTVYGLLSIGPKVSKKVPWMRAGDVYTVTAVDLSWASVSMPRESCEHARKLAHLAPRITCSFR
jgi:hypothetical protein